VPISTIPHIFYGPDALPAGQPTGENGNLKLHLPNKKGNVNVKN